MATLLNGERVVAFGTGQHRLHAVKRVDGVCRVAVKLAVSGGPCVRRRNELLGAGRFLQQLRALLEEGFHVVDRIAGTGDFVAGSVHIDHEARRGNADQHQHHQANAFLAIVRAVGERDANGGQN